MAPGNRPLDLPPVEEEQHSTDPGLFILRALGAMTGLGPDLTAQTTRHRARRRGVPPKKNAYGLPLGPGVLGNEIIMVTWMK